MASVEDCRAALARLAAALTANADEVRRKATLDRTVVCRITDLEVSFRGRLRQGELVEVAEGDDPEARITIAAASDDLIALVDGELDFARALATRKVSVRASPLDLLRLRSLL